MTFKEWANNPSGKGSSVMSNKSMYKDLYTKKLNKLILREGNNFTIHLYRGANDNSYYVHIKIPSEVIKSFYYDVVIEFSTANPAYAVGADLDKYDIRVFTNSPDFVFTHTHAYHKAKLLFSDLESKLPKVSITSVAKERNPKDEVGYVKSLYFTYLILTQKKMFNKLFYKSAPVYKKKELLSAIMPAEEKIQLRQEAEARLIAEERRKKSLEVRANNEKRNVGSNKPLSPNSKPIQSVKSVGKTSTVQKSKSTKKI